MICFQSQRLRPSVCHRKHIHTESILQSGLLIQHIGKILRIRIFLQLQNDTGYLPWRTGWRYPRYPWCFLVSTSAATSFKNLPIFAPIIVYGISVITMLLLAAFQLLHLHTARGFGSCLFLFRKSSARSSLLTTMPPVGKSGPLHILHQLFCADIMILHVCLHCVDHLAQVMRRDAGSHTNGDSFCSVYEKIRNPHRKHLPAPSLFHQSSA